MSVKSYKYSHEQKCQGQLQDRPVKPHAKPKAKQTKPKQPPKPPPEVYYSDSEEERSATTSNQEKSKATSTSEFGKCPSSTIPFIATTDDATEARKIQQDMSRYVRSET